MNAVGRLKKYAIDNKVDKDGEPMPILTVTLEFRFSEQAVRSLAEATDGELVAVTIEPHQGDLFKAGSTGKGS